MTDEPLLASIRRAIADASTIAALGQQEFLRDPLLQRAAKNIVAEIGEAAAGLSAESRERSPAIPWRLITGMRHKVVHDYAEVDVTILWNTLTTDLPNLGAALPRS